MEALQKELAQAVSLATKFQEKNERMEMELTNYTRYIQIRIITIEVNQIRMRFSENRMSRPLTTNRKWRS